MASNRMKNQNMNLLALKLIFQEQFDIDFKCIWILNEGKMCVVSEQEKDEQKISMNEANTF